MKPNDYTMFKLSKPWGYYPPDVEKVMKKYEETIGKLNDKLSEKIQLCSRYQERIMKLEEELRAMHIEMSSLELPDTEELVESVVINDFKNYPNGLDERVNLQRNQGQCKNEIGIVDAIKTDESEKQFHNGPDSSKTGLGCNYDVENQCELGNYGLNLSKSQADDEDEESFKIIT